MEKKPPQLTRTCLACGLEKPLAAFLQITGTQGTVYGNLCDSCRSAGAKGKIIIPKAESDSGGGSGSARLKIDAQAKIRIEFQQKLLDKKSKELTHEEKKQREKLSLDKSERKELKEKGEKDHRRDYIEGKKRQTFISEKSKKQSGLDKGSRILHEKSFIAGQHERLEEQTLEAIEELEAKLTTIDVSQLYLDPQFGELKFQSEIFKRFKDWLGTSANFRSIEQLYQKKAESQQKTPGNQKDPFVEQVEKEAKPMSPKRKG